MLWLGFVYVIAVLIALLKLVQYLSKLLLPVVLLTFGQCRTDSNLGLW
ncbi:hypothetical protein [Coleofasciculus sp. F4-SAH-05]